MIWIKKGLALAKPFKDHLESRIANGYLESSVNIKIVADIFIREES